MTPDTHIGVSTVTEPVSKIFSPPLRPLYATPEARQKEYSEVAAKHGVVLEVVPEGGEEQALVMLPGAQYFLLETPGTIIPETITHRLRREVLGKTNSLPGDTGFPEENSGVGPEHQMEWKSPKDKVAAPPDNKIRFFDNLSKLTGWRKGKFYIKGVVQGEISKKANKKSRNPK